MNFIFIAEPLYENDPFVIDILIEECEQEYERRQLSNESGESESEESKSENDDIGDLLEISTTQRMKKMMIVSRYVRRSYEDVLEDCVKICC